MCNVTNVTNFIGRMAWKLGEDRPFLPRPRVPETKKKSRLPDWTDRRLLSASWIGLVNADYTPRNVYACGIRYQRFRISA